MSKLYSMYLENKKIDNSKYYLFKSGIFYIFIGDDAKYISSITSLKLTKLNNNIYKCGFPKSSLDKYLEIFKNMGLDIVIVSDNNISDISLNIIDKIRNIDMDDISPNDAYNIIKKFKDMLNE